MNKFPLQVKSLKATTGVVLVLILSACSSDSNLAELQAYVQQTVNRAPGFIEPLPQFVTYEAFTYSATTLRGPFDVPADIAINRGGSDGVVEPDLSRTKERLEDFSLGSLAMVGTMVREGTLWVLMRDETNMIHKVVIGNYLGRNNGRIVSASETQIDVIEIVPSGGGGWIERPQTIALQQ